MAPDRLTSSPASASASPRRGRDNAKRARLDAAIVAARRAAFGKPFVWGEDDCCLWVANIILAALGYDPARAWRGRYKTARGAYRVMEGRDIRRTLARVGVDNDWSPIAPERALTGDVGIADLGNGRGAVVIRRKANWFGRTDRGFAVVPTAQVIAAWRI